MKMLGQCPQASYLHTLSSLYILSMHNHPPLHMMLHNLKAEIFSFNYKDSVTLLEHVVCL